MCANKLELATGAALPTVMHVITGLNNGGAEGVLFRLVTNSNKYSHVVVSLIDEGVYGKHLNAAGIPVYTLGMRKSFSALFVLPKLYKLIKKLKPDCVQTWMYHGDLIGGLAAKLSGVPAIYWNIRHSDLNIHHSSKSTVLIARFCALLSRSIPKSIVACGSRAQQTHASRGYVESKFTVIPNGYDLDAFRPHEEILNEEGCSTLTLGMVGRYNPQKDHFNLLTALENVNCDFNLKLVGPDVTPDNHKLIEEVPLSIKSSVELLGTTDDVPKFMNSVDIHVLPSNAGEGFPNVVAEAMACGTPCIVTDVGDAAEIVGDTGWVVPPKNPDALARAINEAYEEKTNSPTKWEQRRKDAVKRIHENYSLEKMVKAYEDLWASGIKDK